MSIGKAITDKALQSIQWRHEDWFRLGDVAKSVGLTRSDFIRRAALAAADAHQNGMTPYFVSEPKASPQNTRINLFRPAGDQKLATGGGQDAGGRSRSDCEAKTASNERSEVRS